MQSNIPILYAKCKHIGWLSTILRELKRLKSCCADAGYFISEVTSPQPKAKRLLHCKQVDAYRHWGWGSPTAIFENWNQPCDGHVATILRVTPSKWQLKFKNSPATALWLPELGICLPEDCFYINLLTGARRMPTISADDKIQRIMWIHAHCCSTPHSVTWLPCLGWCPLKKMIESISPPVRR